MKVKANIKPHLVILKKNSPLYIFDCIIENINSFYFKNKKFYHEEKDLSKLTKIQDLYFRVKKVNYFKGDLIIEKTNELNLNNFSTGKHNLNIKQNTQEKVSKSKVMIENDNHQDIVAKSNNNIDIHTEIIKESNSNNKKLINNINQDLYDTIKNKNKNNIKNNRIKIVKIESDGNCFYRCLSYFFLMSTDYYPEFKNIIIEWIENNYDILLISLEMMSNVTLKKRY